MMITRRKPRESKSKDEEELMTIVKAAAWAWFQHGSDSEGKSFQEFQLTRSEKHIVRPSRFKLEARRVVMEINNNDLSSESSSDCLSLTLSPSQTDNSLLDAYEIEQISRHLDCLIESSSNDTRHRRSWFASDRGHKKNLVPPLPPPASPGSKKKLKGSWLRYGAVCSSREGVVEPRLLNGPSRRMQGPNNHQRKIHYNK